MPDESKLYGQKYTHLENDPYVTIIPVTQPFHKTPGSQVLSRFCSTFSSVPAPAPAGVGTEAERGEKGLRMAGCETRGRIPVLLTCCDCE